MKFLALLGVLAMQCALTKSWTGDNGSDDTFFLIGWISYLKRLSVIVLMLSAVVLYYVPESRPYARRACYVTIDFAANRLKSALTASESEYIYEKIKSKYHRARYEQFLAQSKQHLREVPYDNDEEYDRARKLRANKTKVLTDDDESTRDQDRRNAKRNRVEKRHSRQSQRSHRHRSDSVRNMSESCVQVAQPTQFYSGRLEDLQKYLKSTFDEKQLNGASVENYAFLISGSPRQMAMLDQKYEKDDVVILQDSSLKLECKECSTSTDKLVKPETVYSDHEGPTRDHNRYATDSGMEAFACKNVASSLAPEVATPRYSECQVDCRSSRYQCGGCCGNDCSSVDFNENSTIAMPAVSKLEGSFTKPEPGKKEQTMPDNLDVNSPSNYDRLQSKSHGLPAETVLKLQREDQKARPRTQIPQKYETARQSEDSYRNIRRLRMKNEPFPRSYRDSPPDRRGEADDENSRQGRRATAKRALAETAQRKSRLYLDDSDESLFFEYDYGDAPLMTNRLKPALLRAVNWIFGGCPEACKKAETKHGELGKEEIRGATDEWLL